MQSKNKTADNKSYPSYLDSYQNGSLKKITQNCFEMLASCRLCPSESSVIRVNNELGFCNTGLAAKVYSFMPHHGEEPPISGTRGSGTIFFSGCNMSCSYCQNFEFSQLGKGKNTDSEKLAEIMLELQKSGCHNINLVTPTHVLPQILKALLIAIPRGLSLPLVYNTGGYELPEIIRLLEGIVDIYLPDMRYAEDSTALNYSLAAEYPKYNRAAIKEMYRQVKEAVFDDDGIIKRGLIIRHLVLPGKLAETKTILEFIASEISTKTYVSLMSQYMPLHKAANTPELSRRITKEEYQAAVDILENCGLSNGWTQEAYGKDELAGTNIKPITLDDDK